MNSFTDIKIIEKVMENYDEGRRGGGGKGRFYDDLICEYSLTYTRKPYVMYVTVVPSPLDKKCLRVLRILA